MYRKINKYKNLEYQLLLDNTQEIILFFDKTGRVFDCSKKAKEELGFGEDIVEASIASIFKEAFHFDNIHIKAEKKFINTIQETIAYRKNQTCFSVEMKVNTMKKFNKFIGICTAVNITNKKNIARDMYYLKKELNSYDLIGSEMIAKIAHELRTPLNGIMGFASTLMDLDLKPDQQEAVKIINKCSLNLNSLINDLMEFSLLSNNRVKIETKMFQFHDFIQHVIDINIGSINEKNLKFLLYIANDIPDRLIGDELRLSQVLNNLFANAIKFTSVGQISLDIIKVAQTENELELLFILTDTGIGIDLMDQDKLFRSFSQVDSTITRNFGGTGLGLSICKKLVEAMNGNITVSSEKFKGSAFSFTVRLGIVADVSEDSNDVDYGDTGEKLGVIAENEQDQDISDIDYVSRRLIEIANKKIEVNKLIPQKDIIDIHDLMEKLSICVEMESWEKSEQLACKLKDNSNKLNYLNSKDVLQLLIAIRREDHDSSILIINKIKEHVRKEE